jgi:hypothetical protein
MHVGRKIKVKGFSFTAAHDLRLYQKNQAQYILYTELEFFLGPQGIKNLFSLQYDHAEMHVDGKIKLNI